jgi:hypothetical protein
MDNMYRNIDNSEMMDLALWWSEYSLGQEKCKDHDEDGELDERMVLETAVENEVWQCDLGQIQCLDFTLAALNYRSQ